MPRILRQRSPPVVSNIDTFTSMIRDFIKSSICLPYAYEYIGIDSQSSIVENSLKDLRGQVLLSKLIQRILIARKVSKFSKDSLLQHLVYVFLMFFSRGVIMNGDYPNKTKLNFYRRLVL